MKEKYVAWSEGGGGIIREVYGKFELYEVPQYGGEERYEGSYNTFEEAETIAKSWT